MTEGTESLARDPDLAASTVASEGDLLDRYRTERDKRLAAAGVGQYVAPEGELARYLDDPYADHASGRAPVVRDVEVAIIGAGFGGLQTAAELTKHGITDFTVIDKASDFGGVWYWNRYPGASCDIESYIYMPMLEDMGYVPSLKYARGPEIFSYARSIAERFGLYEKALLQTLVEALTLPVAVIWLLPAMKRPSGAISVVCAACQAWLPGPTCSVLAPASVIWPEPVAAVALRPVLLVSTRWRARMRAESSAVAARRAGVSSVSWSSVGRPKSTLPTTSRLA